MEEAALTKLKVRSFSSQHAFPHTGYLLGKGKRGNPPKRSYFYIFSTQKINNTERFFKRFLWKRATAVTRTMMAKLISNQRSPFRLPTPFRKIQLTHKTAGISIQQKQLYCCAPPFPRQPTVKGVFYRIQLTLDQSSGKQLFVAVIF